MNKYTLGAVLVLMLLVAVPAGLYLMYPTMFAPQHASFSSMIVSKPVGMAGWFENGTVIWNKQANDSDINVAIVVPIPIPAQLNDTNFIAVAYHLHDSNAGALQVGDIVNVRGTVYDAERNNTSVHYVRAAVVVKTGAMAINDPDFQHVLQTIQEQQKKEDQSDFMMWFILYYVVFMDDEASSDYDNGSSGGDEDGGDSGDGGGGGEGD